jgi:hypothetical protein
MSKKHTYEYVKSKFEERGYKLLSKEYNCAHDKLEYQCHCGYIGSIKFYSFANNGKGCPKCGFKSSADKQKYSFNYVKNFFAKFGYTILEKEYINFDTKMKFLCPKNHIHEITFHKFKSGRRCGICNKERLMVTGEKHQNWNANISSEERDKRRLLCGNYVEKWRKLIFIRDNYTCKCCGQYGGKLNVHHIYNWSSYFHMRFMLSNGITLCNRCHNLYHKEYGKMENNISQLLNFIKDKKYDPK